MREQTASKRLVAVLASAVAAVLIGAVPVQADPTGPTAFYFSATCTGLGDVILTNAGPSQTAALQVLGSTAVVLLPVNRGIIAKAIANGTSCTFTGFGPSPDDLTPFPPRPPDPVVITGT